MNLNEELSQSSLETLKGIYRGKNEKNFFNIIDVFGDILQDKEDINKLEELIYTSEFKDFLRNTINSSVKRFSQTASKLGTMLVQGLSLEPLKNVLKVLNQKRYKRSLKTYFTPPVDYELYDIFESELFIIAHHNPELVPGFLFISEQFGLKDIKMSYQFHPHTFQLFISQIRRLYIIHENPEFILNIIELITDHIIYRFINYYESLEEENDLSRLNEFINILFEIFINIRNEELSYTKRIISWIHRFSLSGNNRITRKTVLPKILNLVKNIFSQKVEIDLKKFMELYPYKPKHANELVWQTLFECEIMKITHYIEFFISPGFIRFLNHYQYNEDILIFLMKHILMLLKEVDISGFPSTLMPVVLQLLIKENMDVRFLRKRQNFAKWLSKTNSSTILESFFVRILLYEYIFIHKDMFEKDPDIILTRFLDSFHKLFCETLDEQIPNYAREEERAEYYMQLYQIGRSQVWKPVVDRFDKFHHEILELSTICETLDIDDLFLTEIEKVPEKFFPNYFNPIRSALKNKPEEMENLLSCFFHDYWYRLYFYQASPEIFRTLLPVVGNVNILPANNNSAYTDGLNIFLPQYISYFPDDPHILENNRNLTLYIGIALHEAGHIISGSFKFNFQYLIMKMKHPQLFHLIFNNFEDYRIEHYLMKIQPHKQIDEILTFMNLKLSLNNNNNDNDNVIFDFLIYVYDSAYGLLEQHYELSPETRDKHMKLLDMKFPCGRFRNLKNFAGYLIDRLKHLDMLNPFASFYLAHEIYEIMILWPPEMISDAENLPGWSKDGILQGENHIMSEEELRKMYDEFNENPKKYYDKYELPIYDEAFPDQEKENRSDKDTKPEGFAHNYSAENIKHIILTKELDYEHEGTFDVSVHTKVDDIAADKQKENKTEQNKNKDLKTSGNKQQKKKIPTIKKKNIISLNKKTNTRILITNCYEHTITAINKYFLNSARKYEYISRKILNMLMSIMDNNDIQTYEFSSVEGDINLERLIEIIIDINHHQDYDFLEFYPDQKKDIMAIIGMDVSGSTALPINPKATTHSEANINILDIEKYFALIFAKALKIITQNVDVYAFDSVSSTNIYHAVPMEALSSFKSGANNRDGDFIRYMKYLFSRSEVDLKYFFLITDGSPTSNNYEGKYALDDTLLAMRECKKEGIRLFYFNIDNELRDYFTYFKQEAFYAEHFSHPEQLIHSIPNLMMSIANEVI